MPPKLRPWTMEDLGSLVRYANNAHIAQFMTDKFPHPYTEESGRNFIAFANHDQPVHIFAIEWEGEAVGGIGIHPQDDIQRRNAELGYWLSEPHWGKGIMTSAIRQIIPFAFENFEIDRLFARTFGSNKASQQVLEKNGFVLEAKFAQTLFKNGTHQDEWIYAVRRTP